jgi:ATP-binding cassette subfamily B protein
MRNHKYLHVLNTMLKGSYKFYILTLLLLICSTFFAVLSSFISKILIDVIQYQTYDVFISKVFDPLTLWLTGVMGGFDFLKAHLWIFSIVVVTIALAIAFFSIARQIARTKVITNVAARLQSIMFDHVERLPYRFIKTMRNGDIIQTCTKDQDTVRRFIIGDMMTVFYTFDMLIFAFSILLTISWKIALVSIVILPALFIYSFFIIKPVRKRYRLTDDSEAAMTAKIEENLSAVRIVKAFNNENYETEQFNKYVNDYKKKFINWRKLSSFFFSSSDILVFGQIAASTLYGMFLCMSGEISVSTIVISTTYVSMIVWPFRDVATTLSNLASVLAALDRINILLEQPQEDLTSGIKPLIKGGIEFVNVGFKFPDDTKETLKNINFSIKPGETVAIVGKTGSGKSTLAYLLTRLYDVTCGEILIDGTPINDIQRQYLRQHIAMILQEPFLFSKSIISNINISKDINDPNKIFDAAKIAHIDDSIRQFKEGYNTQVGEKGVTLSGGQKQRVAIARGIARNAPILIMDDSLSAVDTETDVEIRSALKKRMENTTCLIITHRVATAKDADKIIVLENNTVSQIGTYDQLIHEEGLFKRINDIQTKMQ